LIGRRQTKLALASRESARSDAALGLEALKLQSMNLQFRLAEENRLIISNSQTVIDNLQQNMDTLAGSFDSFNGGYQKYIELFS